MSCFNSSRIVFLKNILRHAERCLWIPLIYERDAFVSGNNCYYPTTCFVIFCTLDSRLVSIWVLPLKQFWSTLCLCAYCTVCTVWFKFYFLLIASVDSMRAQCSWVLFLFVCVCFFFGSERFCVIHNAVTVSHIQWSTLMTHSNDKSHYKQSESMHTHSERKRACKHPLPSGQ